MATVDLGVGWVKVRAGVWGPATCARSTERPPTPAIAWKNVLREKLMGMSPCSQQDFKTPLYANYGAAPTRRWIASASSANPFVQANIAFGIAMEESELPPVFHFQ